MGDISTTAPSELSDPVDKSICLICKKQFSKYTCPKCTVGYCSLSCYKNHSNLCTRSFYEDNIAQHMKSQKATDEEKLKMMMSLKRLEQENTDIVAEMMKEGDDSESEDDDEDDALSKLRNMNLDAADADTILSMLTPEQRAEFQESIAKGKIGNWIDIWSPWWLHEEEKPLVTQITPEDEPTEPQIQTPVPKIENPIPNLSTITAHPPSPIYSYAYTLRLFNGDWTSDPVDAATTLSTLSSVLSSNAIHASSVSAVQDAVRRSLQPPISSEKEFSISIILDTANILSQKNFVLAALSNLREMFLSVEAITKQKPNTPKKEEKPTNTQKPNPKHGAAPKNNSDSTKQIAFNGEEESKFEHLENSVRSEWISQSDFLKQSSTPTVKVPVAPKKPIIEEIV